MINIVLGTKAQLIKMAPVMKLLQEKNIDYRFIHTGQHKETMDIMYRDFKINGPDITLYNGPDIISIKQIVPWTFKLLWQAVFNGKKIFAKKDKENIVLVHGDTFSTLIGALMGRLSGLKVGHVESGLRSFNIFNPFPEELVRLVTFRLSDILFCPGQWAINNVRGYRKDKINTGANTLRDTVELSKNSAVVDCEEFNFPFGLVSIHRYENIFKYSQLMMIVEYLEAIALQNHLILIMHPPTKKQLQKYAFLERLASNPRIECTDRFNHSRFLEILYKAEFVITDGGSLQEETSYLGKPCLLFRKATERREGLGKNVVLSRFDEHIIDNFISNYQDYIQESEDPEIGPSEIIVQYLKMNFSS
jgi:UDP-N-acetylglucosamine 2-epimerase (non-hydrolysing)